MVRDDFYTSASPLKVIHHYHCVFVCSIIIPVSPS